MKKSLSLIIAVLLLASSMTACGNSAPTETTEETDSHIETKAPDTVSSDTEAPETEAPEASYDASLLTENGIANAHIVVSERAGDLEKYAAEELVYHIKLVSGADISVVSTVQGNSLPIIIATPDSLPELETLFPEDLAWLRTLTEEGTDKRYGDDGFAIRQLDGKLYIFGATEKGALNGVYDFIEDNMGVLWTRTEANNGTIYVEQPTITVTTTDYAAGHREKSPFTLRGYSMWGREGTSATETLYSRNKLSASLYPIGEPNLPQKQAAIGITGVMLGHDVQEWILASPTYDPNCTEYWNELEDGIPVPVDEAMRIKQVNYWSPLTVDTVAASVIAYLDANPLVTNVSVSVEDNNDCKNYPECTLPFEYAPGEFVNPGDRDYYSTLFFTFLNRVAAQVGEKHPDVTINTLAYWLVEVPPRCELDDSIRVFFAPISKCESGSLSNPDLPTNVTSFQNLEEWKTITKDILFYDYYFCYNGMEDYERPIWYDMQKDLIYYAENGYLGPMAQGYTDKGEPNDQGGVTLHEGWILYGMTAWIYHKLCWNPYEDIDALIVEFCDKVYGAASDEMQEYCALLYKGWIEGESEGIIWNFKIGTEFYLDRFVYQVDLENDIKNVLRKAYEEADTDTAKERIGYLKSRYELHFPDEE